MPPRGSEFGKALRGPLGHPRGATGIAPLKNSAHISRSQTPPWCCDGCAIALVGGASAGLRIGQALRESSGWPRGGADRAPSKTSARRSGGKRPQGRRDGFAIALVGGYWAWPPWGSDLGKGLRGPSGRPRDDVGRAPPYNSARRSGGQSLQGRARRVCYSLGGGEGCGLRGTQKGARLFKGTHGV